MGPKNFEQLHDYSKTSDVVKNHDGLKQLVDIIKKVQDAQDKNLWAINIEGYDHQQHTFLLRLDIDTGVFNKCGNYTPLYREKVAIVPKQAQMLKVFATESKGYAGVDVTRVKKFYGLTGGISATVEITPAGEIIPPKVVTPAAGPGGKVDVDTPQHPTPMLPGGGGSTA